MTARNATSDVLAPVVDDLAVDDEVDVEAAAHLAGSPEDALLTHPETLGDGAAPEVVDAGAKLRPMQPCVLVAARHQRVRGAGDQPTPDELLVEPEPELPDIVGPGDHQIAAAGEVVADPDPVAVHRAAVVDARFDVGGLGRRVDRVVHPVEPSGQTDAIGVDHCEQRIRVRDRIRSEDRATAELDVQVGPHVRTLRARHSSSKMPYPTESRYPSATRMPSRHTPSSRMPRRAATARDRTLSDAACSSTRWSPSSSNARSKNRSHARVTIPRPSCSFASQ